MGILDGLTVLVTGASQGIGHGLAHAAAQAGANVVVTARSRDKAQGVVDEIVGRGGKAAPAVCDVTKRADIEAAVTTALSEYGQLDSIVHNAMSRLTTRDAELQVSTEEEWEDQYATSVRASYHCAQAGFAALSKTRGSLILMVSNGSLEGSGSRPVYSEVKGAQRGLIKALAREWGPHGVRVNGVAPVGMTPTIAERIESEPQLKSYIEFGSAQGRIGDAERDIGPAVAFLACPQSAYITGQTLLVNGGTTML